MLRRRLIATSIALVVGAAALTGCVRNQTTGGVEWLDGRDGIVGATILADNTGPWSSSGLVRGELEPGIDDAGIARLIDEIQGYWRNNPAVGFRLGRDDVDFAVSSEEGESETAVELWHQVTEMPSVRAAVVFSDQINAYSLREDTVEALGELGDLGALIQLESFPTLKDLVTDTQGDNDYGGVMNPLALLYWLPADCDPDAAVREFAESLVERDDIEGGTIELCEQISLGLPSGASLAAAAPVLRAELDERGLSEFPVTVTTALTGSYDTHTAAITPGDAGALAVLSVFEQDGAPETFYELDAERTLSITSYETPTPELIALISGAPAAASLPQIHLEGTPVTIYGPLYALTSLHDQAIALDAASDAFGSIELGVDSGSAYFEHGVGAQPDVETAAADLRASGATEGRRFTLRQQNYELYIVDGVAEIGDPDYVGAESMLAFIEIWNAGGVRGRS
jgi:hypothetical protein